MRKHPEVTVPSGSGRQQVRKGRRSPAFVPGVPGVPVHVTFRLRQPHRALYTVLGLLFGMALAVPAFRWQGWRAAVPVALVFALGGWIASVFLVRDRCIERGCGAMLPRSARTCPKCGSAIMGVVAVGGRHDE